ncbi:hypothetical protein PHYBLDRAFT_145493 [Phycomyces blakesleeanus NRRL 1555(-)]|uniref:Uncharacterized protein n=1 Tax=Phycomyces blakesleeanus (strain ATCC 8743b / DSM 1359 / FGSC 10004 / NBRC 33097 / NRRL 1555) TaxID=763407 RepID=A0A167MUJ9_PHYB8|nr:hypothetical protein PHYBLDRAFT_145493 [Phycomyces blakesleeanus NRRL 1555(-)]OAD74029.1 hypothetical protein PHYBLDRAFT_145493 [Phycomyces blakesleeanus NRRL 1555(-)]|eukprot:XP_018292069.1 hypothetical protein PHYBLDRAFT_145493 [Phycomyces blakesleeanus NRRL 1555(-)]
MYENTRIHTAYIVNIDIRFGQHLRREMNVLLDIKKDRESLPNTFDVQKGLSTRQLEDAFTEEEHRNTFMAISPIFVVYPEIYGFQKNYIYYDSNESPHRHFLTFSHIDPVSENFEKSLETITQQTRAVRKSGGLGQEGFPWLTKRRDEVQRNNRDRCRPKTPPKDQIPEGLPQLTLKAFPTSITCLQNNVKESVDVASLLISEE